MDFDAQAGTKPGLEVWRIENMKPVRVEKKEYGKFYSGDCYIVLNTYEKFGKLGMDLHFWLGDHCSQDEKGAVAYQTVFLDDKLGGLPVQHRETQGHESPQFLALFKSGIEILDGGVASAFRHVDPNAYQPRLFHVKGKRNVRVMQVAMARSSLNDGDVFILDKGLTLYQWNGAQANKYEKFKGLEITTKIKNEERGGKPEVVVLESGKGDSKEEGFWSLLGGYGPVKSEAEGGSDETKGTDPKLLQYSSGSWAEIAVGKLTKDQLDTSNIYIVEPGTEVFVWIGKGSNLADRKEAMKLAQAYLAEQSRPDWTPVTKLIETGETPAFKACFNVWDPPRVVDFKQSGPVNKAEIKIDGAGLHKATREAEEKMVDDAKGKVKIWRIENFDKNPIDESEYGQFFMGDSYIVLYEFLVKNVTNYIIYFWQGRASSTDEKGASALLTKQMDDDLTSAGHKSPTQVRVVQDKEPNHFLSLFKGKMIVHHGGAASGFKNRQDVETAQAGGNALYHIKGTNAINTRAVQVDAVASNLNSGDVFVLLTPGQMYIWNGSGANDTERATAKNVATQILQGSRSVVEFSEGDESDDFWAALGGKAEYPCSVSLAGGDHEPRLFHATNTSGKFKVEEVFDFSQDDLINDDVMLLDTFEAVYVWIGHNAMQEEKDGAMMTALDYVKNAPDGRDPACPVYKVIAGSEPPVFTCHFRGWNEDRAVDFSDPYQKKLHQLQASGAVGTESKADHKAAAAAPAAKAPAKLEAVTADSIGFAKGTFSYADLKAKKVPNIDMSKQESYLSDAEFQTVFKTTKAEFAKLPKWKQDAAKKTAGLF